MEAGQADGLENLYTPYTRLYEDGDGSSFMQSALPSDDEVTALRRFNSYPWKNDREFLIQQLGLDATAGKVTKGPDGWSRSQTAISVQARIWYYAGKFGTSFSRGAYDQYVADNPADHQPDEEVLDRLATIQALMSADYMAHEAPPPPSAASAGHVAVPAWQVSAPAADLTRKAGDRAAAIPAIHGQAAPQSWTFDQIMEAVKSGKTVPGLREIKSHIARVPGLSPVGKIKIPPKPWERKEVQQWNDVEAKAISTVLDPEFPSLQSQDEEEDEERLAEDMAAMMREG